MIPTSPFMQGHEYSSIINESNVNASTTSTENLNTTTPTRRNLERIRKSIKDQNPIQLQLRKTSYNSDDSFTEIYPFSGLSGASIEDKQPLSFTKLSLESVETACTDERQTPTLITSKLFEQTENIKEKTAKEIFQQQLEDADSKLKESIHFLHGNFSEFFEEKESIGQGCSGIVKKCIHRKNGQKYAVKIIETQGDEERIVLEINQFKQKKQLSHKYIVSVYEMYIDLRKNKIYTTMELVDAPNLQTQLELSGKLDEQVAAKIFQRILFVVQYLHANGVCHRDLKLDNILSSADANITRILDFDVSKFKKQEKKYSGLTMNNMKMWTYTGDPAFLAPEFFEDMEYTEAVDLWSTGVVLYAMLVGHLPFASENPQELIKEITSSDFNTKCEGWHKISKEAQELISSLLQKDYKKRLTPFEALTHDWIKKNTEKEVMEGDWQRNPEELYTPLRLRKKSGASRTCIKKNEKKSFFSGLQIRHTPSDHISSELQGMDRFLVNH